MSMRKFLLFSFVAAALSGCATGVMSEKQCLAGDWRGAGLEDGLAGKLRSSFDERAARCSKFDAGADAIAYSIGREAGLSRLCTSEGGYEYGRAGAHYRGVCRAEAEGQFMDGYLSGRRIFGLESARNGAQTAYDDAARALDYQRNARHTAHDIVDDPDASPEAIEEARRDLDYARGAIPRTERAAEDALYELGRADEALDQGIASSATWLRGDEFERARLTLLQAHDFARHEDAIDHCTDDMYSYLPVCYVRPGAVIKDADNGRACVIGPGEARLAGHGGGSFHAQTYEFYPSERGSGRTSRRPAGQFIARFVSDDPLTFSRVLCTAPLRQL